MKVFIDILSLPLSTLQPAIIDELRTPISPKDLERIIRAYTLLHPNGPFITQDHYRLINVIRARGIHIPIIQGLILTELINIARTKALNGRVINGVLRFKYNVTNGLLLATQPTFLDETSLLDHQQLVDELKKHTEIFIKTEYIAKEIHS